jgi:transcriptional regulator with XRE-family HTH domain
MAEPLRRNIRRSTRSDVSGRGASLLGDRLRRARLERGFSLRELARRLDVSPSLVSQIETSKLEPSVRTLYAIVSELGVSLDDVIAEHGSAADARVRRSAERSAVGLHTGVRWEQLTPGNDRDVDFLYAVYPPGSESAPAEALVRHNGREFGLVLTGRLGVTVGFDDYILGPGDSVSFESTIPHRLHNDGREPATAVWVVLGRNE